MDTQHVLESLATLLTYPTAGYSSLADNCCEVLEREMTGETGAKIRQNVEKYRTVLRFLSAEELEEFYTRTFDLNPVCSLDIGWHLYAENYDRGTFLVEMRNELKEHGLKESTELPDHLPMVLRLLARMAPERAVVLATKSVLPAVRKMVQGFSNTRNPYAVIIEMLEPVLIASLHLESGVLLHDDHQ